MGMSSLAPIARLSTSVIPLNSGRAVGHIAGGGDRVRIDAEGGGDRGQRVALTDLVAALGHARAGGAENHDQGGKDSRGDLTPAGHREWPGMAWQEDRRSWLELRSG